MSANLGRGVARLLVSVAGVLVALVLAEAGLRIYHQIDQWRIRSQSEPVVSGFPPIYDFSGSDPRSAVIHQASSIPGLGYEMAPNRELRARNGILMKTNQFGMRDDEPSAQQTDSPCRIAVLGDSYTFGLGVQEEETYPKVLEKLLRQSPVAARCQFEVLNFGVVGYSAYDESLVLRYRVVDFNPRVIVIGYVLNDPEIDPTVQTLHRYYSERPWWRQFRIFTLPGDAKTNWDINRLGGGDYYVYLHAPKERKWQSVVDAFRDIRDVAAQHHSTVLVVIFPELTKRFKGKPWSDYPYAQIHQQVADLATGDGFRVVDLRAAFSRYPSQDVVLPGTDDHPSVRGHMVAAEAIEAELLGELGYFFQLEPQQSAAAAH